MPCTAHDWICWRFTSLPLYWYSRALPLFYSRYFLCARFVRSLCLHGSADPCEFLWFLFSLFACRLFIIFISHLAYCDFPSIPSSEYERTKLIPFGLLPTLHKTKEPMVMTLLPPHTYDIFCHGNDATNHMTQKFVRPLLQCSSEKLFLFVLCPSSHFSQTHHSNIF